MTASDITAASPACEITGCSHPPYARYRWGLSAPLQEATLCETHGLELFERMKSLCHWKAAAFSMDALNDDRKADART